MAGAAASIRLLDINLGGIHATGHGTMHIPEGALLRVQHFAFQFVPLLGHLALRFSLPVGGGEGKELILYVESPRFARSTCMKMNSHLRENIFCSLARFSAS